MTEFEPMSSAKALLVKPVPCSVATKVRIWTETMKRVPVLMFFHNRLNMLEKRQAKQKILQAARNCSRLRHGKQAMSPKTLTKRLSMTNGTLAVITDASARSSRARCPKRKSCRPSPGRPSRPRAQWTSSPGKSASPPTRACCGARSGNVEQMGKIPEFKAFY